VSERVLKLLPIVVGLLLGWLLMPLPDPDSLVGAG
jgi:hypothetical protein